MKTGSQLPLVILLVFMGAIMLITSGGHLYSPDEEVMFRVTESLAHWHLAIEPMEQTFGTQTGRNGQEYAQYGLGNSIAALPFYWCGRIANAMWPGDSLREILNTSSMVNRTRYDYSTRLDYARRYAVSHLNILITLLQVLVIFLFARDLTRDDRAAALVALTYGFATQAWPHAKTFFSEPLATLGLTAGTYLIWRGMRMGSVKLLWAAGCALGVAVLTRLDSLVAMPGIAVLFYMLLFKKSESDESPRPPAVLPAHIAAALPGLLVLGLIMALNLYKFGSPLATGYEDQQEGLKFNASLAESIPGFLWSPGRSMFAHSPPLILAVVGFIALIRLNLPLALGVGISAFTTLLVQSLWQNWSGGWDWGPRHIFSLCAWGMIPLAALFTKASPLSKRLSVSLCALFLLVGGWVQTHAISQNPLEFYSVFYYRSALPNGYPIGAYYEIARREDLDPPLIQDSIWKREWSAWDGYTRMSDEMHVHDFFWLRWLEWRRAQGVTSDGG